MSRVMTTNLLILWIAPAGHGEVCGHRAGVTALLHRTRRVWSLTLRGRHPVDLALTLGSFVYWSMSLWKSRQYLDRRPDKSSHIIQSLIDTLQLCLLVKKFWSDICTSLWFTGQRVIDRHFLTLFSCQRVIDRHISTLFTGQRVIESIQLTILVQESFASWSMGRWVW